MKSLVKFFSLLLDRERFTGGNNKMRIIQVETSLASGAFYIMNHLKQSKS